jgi:hypothetical protein
MALTRPRSSLSSASRDGMECRPRRCAPRPSTSEADRPRRHRLAHQARHVGDLLVGRAAFRRFGPITQVRTDEWPEKQATLGPTPSLSSMSRYCGKLRTPSGCRRAALERHALDMGEVAHGEIAVGGLAGSDGEAAIAQTAVVTPSAGEGSTNGSQVICAS